MAMSGLVTSPVTISQALGVALERVLETMFFTEPMPVTGQERRHAEDAHACVLRCGGAVRGCFGVVIDGPALEALCCAFYGEDAVSAEQQDDLIGELTNMLAGAALGSYLPSRSCALSSPWLAAAEAVLAEPDEIERTVEIEGGLLSLRCAIESEGPETRGI
jgi:hypothetical protein